MRHTHRLSSTLFIAWSCVCACLRAQSVPPESSNRPALDTRIGTVAMVHQVVTLTGALRIAAMYLAESYVSFGLELKGGEAQPRIDLDIREGLSLRQVLDLIFVQAKDYQYSAVSAHLINVSPKEAKLRGDAFLNRRIQRFDVERTMASQIYIVPELYIPEIQTEGDKRKIYQFAGPFASGEITLHLRDKTIREIFNAVAEATEAAPRDPEPIGWIYDPDGQATGNHRTTGMFVTSNIRHDRQNKEPR